MQAFGGLILMKNKKKNKISKTFCILPWIHLSTRPNGHARVCCTANASSVGATQDKKYGGEVGIIKNNDGKPANFNHTSLKEAWNNDYMKNIRLQMLNGEIPPSCLKCFKEEAAGHRSKRNWETRYWSEYFDINDLIQKTNDDGSIEPNIPYIDLRFGTKCNLKCIMCSPHDSSLWIKDWKKLHPQIKNKNLKDTMQWNNKGQYDGASYNWHKNNPKFWQELFEQIPNMKQLYFAGGEALIIEEHYYLLEECIKRGYAKNIELRYNSNGVEWRNDLFELWNHFKRVRFHYSIDAYNKQNDYIRFPSKWEHMEKQFWVLDKTAPSIEVTVACAVQVLNIFYIPDLIRWKLEQKFEKINIWPLGAGLINFHNVYHPAHLNIKILPNEYKEECKEKYEKFYIWLLDNWQLSKAPSKEIFIHSEYGIKRLQGLISFMFSEDWSIRMPEFKEYIKLMDKIRGTNFKETFPEIKHWID